jgi:ubiquinone/menaquinone biosynthesis C-methylase UbiE
MEPWSSFWQQGHSTTFGHFFRGGYEGAVKDWWVALLEPYSPSADILDIGCGNGALVIPTLEVLSRGSYSGVDLAKVEFSAPAKAKRNANPGFDAELFGQTPAESLPFEDNSFDLASSIYGIEYSDITQSTAEIYRVLRKQGKFQALMHASESVITEMTARALGEYRDEDMAKIMDSLTTIDKELNRLKEPARLKSSRKAEDARENLNKLANKYMSNLDPKTGNAIMVQFVGDALKYFKILKQSDDVRSDYLRGLESEFAASRERYIAMANAAMSANQMDGIVKSLKDLGFKSVTADLFYSDSENKELAAWNICALK